MEWTASNTVEEAVLDDFCSKQCYLRYARADAGL